MRPADRLEGLPVIVEPLEGLPVIVDHLEGLVRPADRLEGLPVIVDRLYCDARAAAAFRPGHIEAVDYSVTVAAYGDRFRRVALTVRMMALNRRDRFTAGATAFRPTAFASFTIGADNGPISHHERGRVQLATTGAVGELQWSFPLVL